MIAHSLEEHEIEQGIAQVILFKQPEPKFDIIEEDKDQIIRDKDQIIRDLRTQVRLLQQGVQAFGDVNRYYASLKLGHPANDNEAFDHYVLCGGKCHFDQTHPPLG
jgi:hypothetical protein